MINNDIFRSTIDNLVYKTHVPLDWAKIEPKCTKIINRSLATEWSNYPTTGGTSFTQPDHPFMWDEFANLRDAVGAGIDMLRSRWHLLPVKLWAEKSWINWYDNTAKLEEHDHGHTVFVVTYYLQRSEHSGNMEFRNPLEYHMTGYPVVTDFTLWTEMPAVPGDLLIFPGWLKHRVQPNNTTDRRISLTVNINSHRFEFNDQ